MTGDVELVEVWRGDRIECVHRGHAVICDGSGQIVETWGNPDHVTYPRSSAKMIQALPLVESGAADGLTSAQLALACASHIGASYHTDPVNAWLSDMGLTDADFRCGPQVPEEKAARTEVYRSDTGPAQCHNNCSGKHAGFLCLSQHMKAGPEYVEPDHPIQATIKLAIEEVTEAASPGFGIDGCSAPNHATTMHAMARAMASFATAHERSDTRSAAQVRLRQAMMRHPDLVRGNRRFDTEVMRAAPGKMALKGGAEGYHVAILPDQGLGVAVKISDGAGRGSEVALAAILHRLGLFEAGDPTLDRWMTPAQRNRARRETGRIVPSPTLLG